MMRRSLGRVISHPNKEVPLSRIGVLKLIVGVSNRWNWDTFPDALHRLVIPQWRPISKDAFHLVEEFDFDEHVENAIRGYY